MVTIAQEKTEAEMLTPQELRCAPLEAKLNEWGLSFRVEPEFKVTDIRVEEAAQVRSGSHIAPPDRVEEYAQQMRNGAMFPPLLIRKAGNILIDGNTRLAAAKKIGRRFLPVIIVDAKTEDTAKMLAASLNQMGGERLTAQEAHEAALVMIRMDYPDAAIARELGRDQSQVRRWRAQRDVLSRAETLGLGDLEQFMSRTVAGTLGDIRLEKPFVETAKLFQQVPLKEKEARDFVGEVVQAPSEEAALQVVKDKLEELSPVGPPPRRPTREIPLARAAIGNILKFEGRPSAAFDPRKKGEEEERWTHLGKVVAEIVAAIRVSQEG